MTQLGHRHQSLQLSDDEARVFGTIEQRVLWLATSIIHHANHRPADNAGNADSGIKVGGHQASSASIVTIMAALWFLELTSTDRVSVKPHASPVLHAINYLLGRLDPSYLPTLRRLGGLQPYPSRTKDPDAPDFSTGSVGIGATAPVWSAIAGRYLESHFPAGGRGRQISLLGDAELDEGAIWECVADPMVAQLGEVLWIVDVNRQSLDRIVPDIQVTKWRAMFQAVGWQVIEVKYGRVLQQLFEADGGSELRARIDAMSNEEYQWLLRSDAGAVRARLGAAAAGLSDPEVRDAIRDLGGHDVCELLTAFREVDDRRPTVVFAYTIKGYALPIEGHPANHSALLTEEQYRSVAARLGADPDDPWRRFPDGSAAAEWCARTAARLASAPRRRTAPPPVPAEVASIPRGRVSTQESLGRTLVDLVREAPDLAARVVTLSPDVASSTNAAGWINKVGVWAPADREDWFASDPARLLKWHEVTGGQHIELGIAEVNLVGLLGELGATWSRYGEPLLPIGTVYDPFVGRALEPWMFGVYAGGQSILVGTPSGVTLAPEGGAHQSVITPSIGLEAPGVTCYEPAFAIDLQWCLLDALSRLGRADGESAYLRLSTRRIDQGLAALPDEPQARARRRASVLAGAYRLRSAVPEPLATIAVAGAVVPEAITAADRLAAMGIAVDVVVVSSYDRLWRAAQARNALLPGAATGVDEGVLDRVFRGVPLVTVLDGHPHTLSFLGAALNVPSANLGVSMFGQGGSLDEVYRLHGLDHDSITCAVLDLIDA